MSKNEKKASEREQDAQESDSVYDFLYHDTRRVGSFLAQFDESGHLQQITQSEGVMRGIKRSWRFKVAGSVANLASGEVGAEHGPTEGGSETNERVYDPLWTNARTLLDYLSERNLIQDDLSQAAIGQFVLVEGHLMVLDLSMLKTAWETPAIHKIISQAAKSSFPQEQRNRHERRAAIAQSQNVADMSSMGTDFLMALLSLLPHSVQARVFSEKGSVWCSLDEGAIVGRSSDLLLKHGTLIAGKWHMLGILDAYPNASDDEKMTEISTVLAATAVGQVVANLAPVARQLLGRPDAAFGMTPLLIFREVTGSGVG